MADLLSPARNEPCVGPNTKGRQRVVAKKPPPPELAPVTAPHQQQQQQQQQYWGLLPPPATAYYVPPPPLAHHWVWYVPQWHYGAPPPPLPPPNSLHWDDSTGAPAAHEPQHRGKPNTVAVAVARKCPDARKRTGIPARMGTGAEQQNNKLAKKTTDGANDEDYASSRYQKKRTATNAGIGLAATNNTRKRLNGSANLPPTGIGHWDHMFELLRDFRKKNGHFSVPKPFLVDRFELGKWVIDQRAFFQKWSKENDKKTSIARACFDKLNSIGFNWNFNESMTADQIWNHRFELLRAFFLAEGHFDVPKGFVVGYVNLHHWVTQQRHSYKSQKIKMKQKQVDELNSIGFVWCSEEAKIKAEKAEKPDEV